MKKLHLTGKNSHLIAIIDEEDYDRIKKYKWKAYPHHGNNYVLTTARENGRHVGYRLHRFIMSVSDPKIHVDHIDGNGLNNQKANLRPCKNCDNACNRKPKSGSTSIYLGVSYCKITKKWLAQITKNMQVRKLGRFLIEKDAAIAYNDAAQKLHGEFAKLNIVN